jgi:hypothetical protein
VSLVVVAPAPRPNIPPALDEAIKRLLRVAEEATFVAASFVPVGGIAAGARVGAEAAQGAARLPAIGGAVRGAARELGAAIRAIWRTPGVRLGVGAAAAGAGIASAIGNITTALTGTPNPVFQQPPFAPIVPILTRLSEGAAPSQAQAPAATQSPFLPLAAGLGIGLAAGVILILLAKK